ncbi:MAG: WYL domain-containing protein [Candidatus Omnitrophica bacterium]|nr:WYL domain-containing protein [Candidatus Omnitrophota bacterium]MBU1995802.1 WYL domain-containing protein [Candidatus Omnitrophota bacterium]MBU4334767.1 WYL domain-containing protein [Candidatus Omnitrophota bacterium]
MKGIHSTDFVVFDVETTGLSPQFGDRVIEMAAVKVRDQKIIDRFESLIDPQREVSFEAYLVNGISDEMLVGAPLASEVLPDFVKFIEGCIVVGHNVKFDMKFLNNELRLAGMPECDGQRTIDTVKMSRGIIPELGKYSLAIVSEFMGIRNVQKHRAMADVEMTFKVFLNLLQMASKRRICSLAAIESLFGPNKIVKQHKRVKMKELQRALDENANVELLYLGSNSGASIREVTPSKILGTGKAALLVGYCHLRDEERYFNVDKIIQLETLIK